MINLLIQSLPLKLIEGKVNISSMHSNFAPIELGMYSWYFIVYSASKELVRSKKHSPLAYILKIIGICFLKFANFIVPYS